MNKNTLIFGIDISKDSFDVYSSKHGYQSFTNDQLGFKGLAKCLDKASYCVMEATGCYHQQLAMFLYQKGFFVSVVNPLVIKRFIQMKLRRIKTDKSDAFMIHTYSCEQSLVKWAPEEAYIVKSKELLSLIQVYSRQSTALKNKLHSLESRGVKKCIMTHSLKRQLIQIKKEINLLETELETLITSNESQLLARLKTIPGIGKKTAILLMVSTSNFANFESYKQISSYVGLAPNERSSGSSIRGKTRISKTGDGLLRNHLFMCSFTASIHNPQCKALYERIVSKGKSKKLALIAVCNKLIKQAFGIARSGLNYDPNYAVN